MFGSKLGKILAVTAGLLLLSGSGVSAATITVTSAHISGDFSTMNVTADFDGFADTGDIANQFAILGLQNFANLEEAISFATLTGYPSTGQTAPDHPVPPPPVPPVLRSISIISAIMDHTLEMLTISAVFQGDWNLTGADDFTVIVGLQNNNNGEEAITFAQNVTVSAPPAVGIAGLALMIFSVARIAGRRGQTVSA